MITAARIAQRRMYYSNSAGEQTGLNQKVFMRVFFKRHAGWAHRRARDLRKFRYVPTTPCTSTKAGT
jgi:hypothetical protein